MPGSTPVFALPYPLETEPITATDFQNLANAIDLAQATVSAQASALLQRPIARVQSASGQTSAANATITLNMNTLAARYSDNTGMFNTGTPDRLTCTVAGVYLLSWHDISLLGGYTTVTFVEALLHVNGALVSGERQPGSVVSASPLEVGTHTLWPLNVGDFVQGRVTWNGTGGPATWLSGAALEASYVCPIT